MKTKNKIGIGLVLFGISFPIILNYTLFIFRFPNTFGNGEVWLSFWGNYSGSIIGGLIAYLVAKIQIQAHLKEEERKRTIGQIVGLVKVKFELNKIINNLNILERTSRFTQRDQIEQKDKYKFHTYELDELDESNWSTLSIDDVDLEIALLDLKDFYIKFRKALLLKYYELEIQIKELDLKLELYSIQNKNVEASIESFNIQAKRDELADEMEQAFHTKSLMWDRYQIGGYLSKSKTMFDEVKTLISKIQEIKNHGVKA